jgi:hypothetical protein
MCAAAAAGLANAPPPQLVAALAAVLRLSSGAGPGSGAASGAAVVGAGLVKDVTFRLQGAMEALSVGGARLPVCLSACLPACLLPDLLAP